MGILVQHKSAAATAHNPVLAVEVGWEASAVTQTVSGTSTLLWGYRQDP